MMAGEPDVLSVLDTARRKGAPLVPCILIFSVIVDGDYSGPDRVSTVFPHMRPGQRGS